MKNVILAATFSLLSTAAFAEATMEGKNGGTSVSTNSQGSTIGVQSSQVTGNGDAVSGNGTGANFGHWDQTTEPRSRAEAVGAAKDAAGENGGWSDHK